MRILILSFAAIVATSTVVEAKGRGSGGSVYVRGYTRASGSYVAPHYRSARDGTASNNWTTLGNENPVTGRPGATRAGVATGAAAFLPAASSFRSEASGVDPTRWTPLVGCPGKLVGSGNGFCDVN